MTDEIDVAEDVKHTDEHLSKNIETPDTEEDNPYLLREGKPINKPANKPSETQKTTRSGQVIPQRPPHQQRLEDIINETYAKEEAPDEKEEVDLEKARKFTETLLSLGVPKNRTRVVIQKFFERKYHGIQEEVNKLNDIMRNFGVAERTRDSIAYALYDRNLVDFGIKSEEDEDVKSHGFKFSDDDEVVELPYTRPDGQPVLDKNNQPIFIKLTVGQLRAQQMLNMYSGQAAGNRNTNLEGFLLQNLINNNKEQIQMWRGAIRSPEQMASEWENQLKVMERLGMATAGKETPSQYQKEVASAIRDTGRDILKETRGEVKSMFEALREDIIKPAINDRNNGRKKTTSDSELPQDAPDIPQRKQDELFAAIAAGVAANQEQNNE